MGPFSKLLFVYKSAEILSHSFIQWALPKGLHAGRQVWASVGPQRCPRGLASPSWVRPKPAAMEGLQSRQELQSSPDSPSPYISKEQKVSLSIFLGIWPRHVFWTMLPRSTKLTISPLLSSNFSGALMFSWLKCISFRENGAHGHLEFTYSGEEVSDVPPISILFKDSGHCFDHHGAGAGVP